MTEPFIHPYIPNTAPAARQAMLEAVGAATVDEFYADVPDDLRLHRELDLPAPLVAEQDLARHVTGLLRRNRAVEPGKLFLGAGTYNHAVPAIVDEVINRSEFLTAYAGEPYEDHGRFQALFEYQSLMGALLDLDVVNVPTYDGYQAAATALAMATRITGRRRILVVSDVHPDRLSKVRDYVRPYADVVIVPSVGGIADVATIGSLVDEHTAAVWVETPSHHGALEPALRGLSEIAHRVDALLVVGTEPLSLGAVTPPADLGADIVHGDIQSLGLHPWFGGAHAGFIGVRDDPRFVMEMPSRLFGLESTDVPGEYGFGDVAYERTSFALREEGKEWVGTAAALWGIAAGVYLALMGPRGMEEIGDTILSRTAYARSVLTALPGVTATDDASHFREFVLDVSGTGVPAATLVRELRTRGYEPGLTLDADRLLVCVTEQNTQTDIDDFAAALAEVLEGVKA
ncbi:aminomethyl-transferring glycine dehydrogenase subunit GcvPA [Curtobacterium pusillum]|uniref:Aminomethyl-transferring glycine dehydrogenase subunit GcvPA n=1 Tax=Curtobacterium pusillum TaxID=69373 RepID=A0ABX2M3D5_9MICO|nr:aminomethyl-transferring glycine dehydrogenase subunit GcvPA [Curtobacterium pusillum]NUU12647.1 aminomethyl-transferring glycine dehydrogenase subunit GcvPA [Curtobacterium pusillum]GLK33088.1 putative glycine dehydrogenase (decarboxylating) subunit 1 [Curtobacterium pusillum]